MKKGKIKDLSGKEIEGYFPKDPPSDPPSNKDWFEMTGGQYDDPDHPLNKHDEGQTYWGGNIFDDPNKLIKEGKKDWGYNEQDVNENSAGGGAHAEIYNFDIPMPKGYKEQGKGKVWASLTKSFLNKIEQLEHSESQINIDDTIPSDFIDTRDLRLGGIYMVGGLGFVAKFMGSFVTTVPDGNKVLLQMKRHDTIFYVEEGQLLKATKSDVNNYLNQPF